MNVAAVTTDTDLPAAVDGCRDLMAIVFGEVSTVDTFERACRKADRKAAARPQDRRLERLRRLLEDDVSLERAWFELNKRHDNEAPQATVEALVYELRTYGLAALERPNCRRRLADVSTAQLRDVIARLLRLRPKYLAITDDLLLKLGEQL